jgi:acarbose 7IV-phosphotransferase
MPKILVSGLINIETTLKIEGFPIHYFPVRYPFHGINVTVSGVGYNLAKALTQLGNEVQFLSLIGQDLSEQQVRSELTQDGISDTYILSSMPHTAQSIILYDDSGRRQINVDLKDIQEREYPLDIFEWASADCDIVALCNINFSRQLLNHAQQTRKTIATDVHTIGDLYDDYNRDFMRAADILFMSDEALPTSPENWARQVVHAYGTEILVIGLGAEGALLSVRQDNFLERIPAVKTRSVINTIGAGDALFSAFLHTYAQSHNPYEAIRKAIVFASYKIGTTGAAAGFLDATQLEIWYKKLDK